jgi:ferredoxin
MDWSLGGHTPKREARNPASAKGDLFIDDRCIDCAASREVAPGLIEERGGKSVFVRQPVTEDDTRAAWRAALLCPTASIGKEGRREQAPDLFPQELERGIYRCGYNARSSFGARLRALVDWR